jgi:hypothetical protein
MDSRQMGSDVAFKQIGEQGIFLSDGFNVHHGWPLATFLITHSDLVFGSGESS